MSLVQTEVAKPASYVVSGTTYTFPITKTGADLTTVREIAPAPGAAKHIFLTGALFQNPTSSKRWYQLQENTASAADIFGKFWLAGESTRLVIFPQAKRLTVNVNIGIKCEDNNTGHSCTIFGKVDVKG